MKKRCGCYKKVILILVVALSICAVAFGKDTVSIISNSTLFSDDKINMENDYVDSNENTTKYFERIKKGRKNIKSIKYDEYENILSYSVFLSENKFTNKELKYLNNLLEKGYSEGVIQEVYEFWLTTDEDFSMIGDLCALSDELYGINWVENAFNKLTNNSHGVLDVEDIEAYYKKGLTYEDIYTANILSRKKGKTIQGILDDMLSGKTNFEIIDESGITFDKEKVKNKLNNVNSAVALHIAKSKKVNIEDLPTDDSKILEYLNDIEDKEYNKNIATVKEKLTSVGIAPEKIDREKRIKDNNAHKQKALENGFDVYTINSFRRRGYSYEHIEKASEMCMSDDITPLEALELAKEEN